jgi:hypothetical protein
MSPGLIVTSCSPWDRPRCPGCRCQKPAAVADRHQVPTWDRPPAMSPGGIVTRWNREQLRASRLPAASPSMAIAAVRRRRSVTSCSPWDGRRHRGSRPRCPGCRCQNPAAVAAPVVTSCGRGTGRVADHGRGVGNSARVGGSRPHVPNGRKKIENPGNSASVDPHENSRFLSWRGDLRSTRSSLPRKSRPPVPSVSAETRPPARVHCPGNPSPAADVRPAARHVARSDRHQLEP